MSFKVASMLHIALAAVGAGLYARSTAWYFVFGFGGGKDLPCHVLGGIEISPHLAVSTASFLCILVLPLFIYFSVHGRDNRGGTWGFTGRDPPILCTPLLVWVFRLCIDMFLSVQ